jgi:hypothetical protein
MAIQLTAPSAEKRSFSAVGKQAVYPISPPEARFRQNV